MQHHFSWDIATGHSAKVQLKGTAAVLGQFRPRQRTILNWQLFLTENHFYANIIDTTNLSLMESLHCCQLR